MSVDAPSSQTERGGAAARANRAKKALLALVLLVPAPTVGVLSGMILFPNSFIGALLFGFCKLWMFALPVVWLRWVDREPLSFSPPIRGGFAAGALSGTLISCSILAFYWTAGDTLLDPSSIQQKVIAIGLASPGRYALGALYWILVNSVLEEYVWRWFCVSRCERIVPGIPSVVLSALFFTLHHTVALAVFMPPLPLALCSLGVFVGGAAWSIMYVKYRSVWPGYVSHAIVDLCIFGIGASIVFGAGS